MFSFLKLYFKIENTTINYILHNLFSIEIYTTEHTFKIIKKEFARKITRTITNQKPNKTANIPVITQSRPPTNSQTRNPSKSHNKK